MDLFRNSHRQGGLRSFYPAVFLCLALGAVILGSGCSKKYFGHNSVRNLNEGFDRYVAGIEEDRWETVDTVQTYIEKEKEDLPNLKQDFDRYLKVEKEIPRAAGETIRTYIENE
ncbi:MAG: hypothetical protein V1918_01370 [Planctomycetota bacterium]